MKKSSRLLLTSLFSLTLVVAHAQTSSKLKGWQFIGKFGNGDVQYVDMESLKKERGYVRVRTLMDHKKPVWSVESKKILSSIDEQYIDCPRKRFAILATKVFECNMARCAAKESYKYPPSEAEFEPIKNDSSAAGNLHDLVCQ